MTVSRRLRFEILRRDEHTCRYCGAKAPDAALEVDHVTPVALGGSDAPENLITACEDCNRGKGSTSADETVVADVSAAARSMADALHLAAQERREKRERIDDLIATFDGLWSNWKSPSGKTMPRPRDWENSIERFLTLGLDSYDLERCLRIAMNGPANNGGIWSYMCGVAWNEIRELQDAAQTMVSEPDNEVEL